MKVIVKTLRNVKHEIEVSEGWTVGDIKKQVEGMGLADADAQKLLHKGRILRDSQVATDTFVEGDTIILMKQRKKKKKAVTTEPEVADENSPRSANATSPVASSFAQQVDAKDVYRQIQDMQRQQQMARLKAEAEAKISELDARSEGRYNKAMAAQALALAKGDVALAYTYLTEGIDPALIKDSGFILSDEQKEQVRRTAEAKKRAEEASKQDPSKLTPEQQVQLLQKMRADAMQAQQQAEAELAANPPAGLDLQGMPPRLAMLMANPQMLQTVLGNPMVQQQIQGIMARDKPELFARFQADPDVVGETEEFQMQVFKILAQVMGGPNSAQPLQPRGRPNVIKLAKEESEGITVIGQEFGGRFARQVLLQAYMGCGRDLNQLRDFLRQQIASAAENQQSAPAPTGPNPADDCEPE